MLQGPLAYKVAEAGLGQPARRVCLSRGISSSERLDGARLAHYAQVPGCLLLLVPIASSPATLAYLVSMSTAGRAHIKAFAAAVSSPGMFFFPIPSWLAASTSC